MEGWKDLTTLAHPPMVTKIYPHFHGPSDQERAKSLSFPSLYLREGCPLSQGSGGVINYNAKTKRENSWQVSCVVCGAQVLSMYTDALLQGDLDGGPSLFLPCVS